MERHSSYSIGKDPTRSWLIVRFIRNAKIHERELSSKPEGTYYNENMEGLEAYFRKLYPNLVIELYKLVRDSGPRYVLFEKYAIPFRVNPNSTLDFCWTCKFVCCIWSRKAYAAYPIICLKNVTSDKPSLKNVFCTIFDNAIAVMVLGCLMYADVLIFAEIALFTKGVQCAQYLSICLDWFDNSCAAYCWVMMTTSVENNSVFRGFFEKQKLTGPNFIDLYRQLCLVLSTEDKEKYLEHLIPEAPVAPLGQQVPPASIAAHAAWVKGQKEVDVLMLLTIDLDIQRNLAHLSAYDMLQELKAMFSKQAKQELLQTVREFHTCKQEEGKTVNELHAMLKLHEETLPKKDANPTLHAIRTGRVQKNQKNKPHKAAKGGHGKGKSKMGYAPNNAPFAPKPKTPPPPKKDNPTKDAICHQCGEIGHWGRNCPVYLVELMKKKKLSQGASTSEAEPGALSLYVGDDHRAAVEAIGTYHLELLSGLVIVLNNCHYAPSITRGVISVSRLFNDGFINRFDENNVISVSKNNLVYFMAVPRDGIFEIDMSCSNINDSSMYAISNKKAKTNLDSSLLWHCCLGHISKKRIEKLQHDGLLNSVDVESLGKCVSCLSVEFLDHLKEHGIIAHHTPPYTPQHNGVSERRNQTLLDMVRFMMSQTTLPKSFWDYALETAVRILNMVPTKKGCEALVKRDTLTKPDKLEPRSIKCIFVGYPKEMMRYSFYYPPKNKVFVAPNAEFLENSLIAQETSRKDDQEIDEPQSDINPIRRSTRTRRPTDRLCLYVDAEEHELEDLGEPANYKAALLDPESKKWLDAMNVEMQSMKDNDVCVLVELPPNARTVGSK
ncbi:zinc finger, CCHC-type containing protein [Tanacetum coccineum]